MANPNGGLHTWRFYQNNNSDPDSCTAIGAEGSTTENITLDVPFMVRIGSYNDSTANFNTTVQLRYRVDGGGWNNVSASSSNVRIYDGQPTDATTCDTQNLSSYSTFTWESDGYYDDGDGLTTSIAHAKNTFWEDQWCVVLRSAELSGGEAIEFDVVFTGGTMDTPADYPEVQAVAASSDRNATGAVSLPSLTASGSATHSPPTFNASAALSLPSLTASGVADFGPPFFATAALALAALTATGTATFSAGANDATASLSLPAITASGTATNADPIKLFDSTWIPSGGADTTRQLTIPPGLSGADFVAGRIEDTDNPADAITGGEGKFTEFEWAITPTAAAVGKTWKFRITFGGTPVEFTVTPKLSVTAGVNRNATAALSLPPLTASGTATHAPPEFQATAALGLPALAAAGTATHAPPAMQATAALSLPSLTASGTATHAPPESQATASLTLPALAASGTATHAAPESQGTASLTLPALASSGTATFTKPTFDATAALSLPALTASGTATHAISPSDGTAALTLPALTASGTATHAIAERSATAALTLPALTASGTATHAISPSNATAALTLPALTATGTATHTPPEFQATAALSLPAVTASGAATHTPPEFQATATLSLPALTASGTALFDVQELEGFRWRDDDNNEASATWLELQDVIHSCSPDTELRLRLLIQIPAGGVVQIECAEDGTEDWFVLEGPP